MTSTESSVGLGRLDRQDLAGVDDVGLRPARRRRAARRVSRTVAEVISVRIETLASDLALRSSDRTSAATVTVERGGVVGAAGGRRAAARTSATTTGGSSRPATTTRPLRWRRGGTGRTASAASRARGAARPWPSRRPRRPVAVGPALDQLEVVVGEVPEERLGAFERPGVVVVVEHPGGTRRPDRRATSSMALSSGSVTRGPVAGRPEAERELRRVEQLDGRGAGRSSSAPCPSATSRPGPPPQAQ